MTTEKITLDNVGPVAHLEIDLGEPGITILSGPNGSGKTTSLEGIQRTAAGKGKIPVKDGERSGSIEMPGAKCTISSVTRHNNSKCTIVNLEDQFNLGDLVDPGLKSADAADARRIKALVGLTGVVASQDMFPVDDFPDLGDIDVTDTDDLVEMAAIVKRGYERMARECETGAEKESTAAETLKGTIKEIDSESVPMEVDTARDLHQKAVVTYERSKERFKIEELQAIKRVSAKDDFDAAVNNYTKPSFESLKKEASDAAKSESKSKIKVDQLQSKLDDAINLLNIAEGRCDKATNAMIDAKQHEEMLGSFRNVFEAEPENSVTTKQMNSERDDTFLCEKQLDFAKTYAENESTREKIKFHVARSMAGKVGSALYRDSASKTDDVISNAIDCKHLKVETKDGNTRLVVNHKRGPSTWFGDLSDGEKWLIAIDIALDQPVFADLGEQKAIVVIPQHAFESLDIKSRNKISKHAVKRGIHILTAEASRDVSDGDEIVVKQFGAK